ncbi:MAG: 4-hydroxythreonine-4-phosphate dehydrogenase PdxA [Gammaproteobacteria bacterium]|nr:4-hydroxythreonine-4-phosphate dehydrogenase PdxA [Gammaproteobacteria bacterium]
MTFPRILITAGEPAGIGPELMVKLAQQSFPAQIIIAANRDLLIEAAEQLELPLHLIDYSEQSIQTKTSTPSSIYLIDHPMAEPAIPGQLNPANSQYVLDTLDTAAKMALADQVDAILTGPVHKAVLNQMDDAAYFSGHTEFFAAKASVEKVVMMLETDGLRVALATTHLPLKDVSSAITKDSLSQVIEILALELQSKYNLDNPRILVLGLNPHAGESGLLGQEEIDVIEPVLNELNQRLDCQLIGPLPADTAFSPHLLENADAVLAMYHDQGLPVLKYKGFGAAANITLGLPFIRTSVDHGTGLDIAGKNCASLGSMQYALKQTIELAVAKIQREKHGQA